MHVHIIRSDIQKKWLNFLEMRLSKIDWARAILANWDWSTAKGCCRSLRRQQIDKNSASSTLRSDDRTRPGQPHVTTQRTGRVIRFVHLHRRFHLATETANHTPGCNRPRISPQTVRRHLRATGLRCWRPYHSAHLTRGHRLRHRTWATAHARWRLNDWQNVLFTDECKLMVDSSDKRQHVYWGNGEWFTDACIQEVIHWGRASTMIWVRISYRGKTDIVFLDNDRGRGEQVDAIQMSTNYMCSYKAVNKSMQSFI